MGQRTFPLALPLPFLKGRGDARGGVFSDIYIQVFEKILVFFGFRLLKT